MIMPIVRNQISRLVCVSIDYPTPRDTDPSLRGKNASIAGPLVFQALPASQPWQSVQKSRILHKTIEVDFKGHILCINDVRKWRRKWRTWVTGGYRQTGSR
jgi:hypothetical protein